MKILTMMNNEKKCNECGLMKSTEDFRRDVTNADGLRGICKACDRMPSLIVTSKAMCSNCKCSKGRPNFKKSDSQCNTCVKLLSRKQTRAAETTRKCRVCTRELDIFEHYRQNGRYKYHTCKACQKDKYKLTYLENKVPQQFNLNDADANFAETQNALKSFFKVYRCLNPLTTLAGTDIISKNRQTYLTEVVGQIFAFLDKIISQVPIKVAFEIEYTMFNKDNVEFKHTTKSSKKVKMMISSKTVIENMIYIIEDEIFNKYYEQSGLSIGNITNFFVYVNPMLIYVNDKTQNPISLSGSSFTELPNCIKNTKSCINVKNFYDNKCLLWCLIAFSLEKEKKRSKHPSRLANYNKPSLIKKFTINCTFPVSIINIPTIEKDNNLSINIYKLWEIFSNRKTEYNISLIYPFGERPIIDDNHINLLLYKNHYILITKLNTLFSVTVKGKHTANVCIYCGNNIFTSKEALAKHEKSCKTKFENQLFYLPKENSIKFKAFKEMIFNVI